MPSTKDAAKAVRKEAFGFEANPPRCANCVHYVSPDAKKKRGAYCKKGFFGVMQHSICDRWFGVDGSRLEKD